MTATIKRYDFDLDGDGSVVLTEYPNGDYIKTSDLDKSDLTTAISAMQVLEHDCTNQSVKVLYAKAIAHLQQLAALTGGNHG